MNNKPKKLTQAQLVKQWLVDNNFCKTMNPWGGDCYELSIEEIIKIHRFLNRKKNES